MVVGGFRERKRERESIVSVIWLGKEDPNCIFNHVQIFCIVSEFIPLAK